MFRKQHDVSVSSSSLLRNKEGRSARDALTKAFPSASEADVEALLPAKGIETIKFSSKVVAFAAALDHVPTLVDLDPKAPFRKLLPTICGVWRVPNLLPTLVVPSHVSEFLIQGADLMLPGVFVPATCLPDFKSGQLVSIRVAGNPLPFAVGEAVLSSTDAMANGMRGRGVAVLHCYRDSLWEYAGRCIPNTGFSAGIVRSLGQPEAGMSATDNDSSDSDEDSEDGDGDDGIGDRSGLTEQPMGSIASLSLGQSTVGNATHAPADLAPAPSATPTYPWQSWDADDLLTATLHQALRKHVSASDLPMLANVLYGTHMVAARPVGTELDPRKTRWKKISAFLQHMATSEKLLTVLEDKQKGTLSIVAFDKHHPALRSHRCWPPSLEASVAAAAAGAGGAGDRDAEESGLASSAVAAAGAPAQPWSPPVITEYVRPGHASIRIFKHVAIEAIREGRMPAGSLPPRSAKRRRPGQGSLRTTGDDSGSFDPALALQLVTSVPTVLYTRTEAGGVLQSYVACRGLPMPRDKRQVALDEWLADALTGTVTKGSSGSGSGGARGGDLRESDFPALPQRAPDGSDGGGDDDDSSDGNSEEGGDLSEAEAALAALVDSAPTPPRSPHGAGGGAPACVPREDVTAAWGERLQPMHIIEFPASGDRELHRGAPPQVRIFVKRLQGGRKHTTHVQGYEAYRLPPEQLCREASKLFAAAATTQPAANNPSIIEVFVQVRRATRDAQPSGVECRVRCPWAVLPRYATALITYSTPNPGLFMCRAIGLKPLPTTLLRATGSLASTSMSRWIQRLQRSAEGVAHLPPPLTSSCSGSESHHVHSARGDAHARVGSTYSEQNSWEPVGSQFRAGRQ